MRRFRDWPWSFKLAAVVVTLALLPMVIVTVFSEVTARRDFLRDSGTRNLQQATHTASFIAQYLDDVVGNVQVLARSPAAVEVLSGSQEMRRAARLVDARHQGHQASRAAADRGA